ncbi:hypothetical protein chiPu_0026601 [Chiloscyllium punctatum]|uniref:Maestro-like HEAT-repeats domain-containing protein n=1 Tax=Chiloscyllium punctatum TaxID=137246 RepID=A0A401TJN4_CHIPU|nr:hypothetical protein [Chiloscyllium punctatum]
MEDNKRETAVHIISEMPMVFSRRCDDSREVLENPVSTVHGGLLQLCADASQAVQQMALSAVSTIQSIHLVADGASLEQYQESLVFLKTLPEHLTDPDEGAQFEKCHQVMELICQSLPRCQLDNLLLMVCGSLSDQHPSCAVSLPCYWKTSTCKIENNFRTGPQRSCMCWGFIWRSSLTRRLNGVFFEE